jgi:purine nucleosidase
VGSTHGNCSAAQAAHNALRVLDAIGLNDVPVAVGAESPQAEPTSSPHVHGEDGLGDAGIEPSERNLTGESAVDQLVRLGRELPGELDLLAVGAMTNLALALDQDPEALRRYRSVTILGGLSAEPGPDAPTYYDANVFHSPDAADRLLGSGTPLLVTPIDLSFQAVLSDEHIARMQAATTVQARLAMRILPFYFDFYRARLGRWSASMHDPLAAALAIDPSLRVREVVRPMFVEPCEVRHRAVGRPEVGPEVRQPVTIVTETDMPRFLERLVRGLELPLGELK